MVLLNMRLRSEVEDSGDFNLWLHVLETAGGAVAVKAIKEAGGGQYIERVTSTSTGRSADGLRGQHADRTRLIVRRGMAIIGSGLPVFEPLRKHVDAAYNGLAIVIPGARIRKDALTATSVNPFAEQRSLPGDFHKLLPRCFWVWST